MKLKKIKLYRAITVYRSASESYSTRDDVEIRLYNGNIYLKNNTEKIIGIPLTNIEYFVPADDEVFSCFDELGSCDLVPADDEVILDKKKKK
jgi:hypothetical protein